MILTTRAITSRPPNKTARITAVRYWHWSILLSLVAFFLAFWFSSKMYSFYEKLGQAALTSAKSEKHCLYRSNELDILLFFTFCLAWLIFSRWPYKFSLPSSNWCLVSFM